MLRMKTPPARVKSMPAGFRLRHTLRGASRWIVCLAWSPDGRILAAGSADHAIRLWDAGSGGLIRTLEGRVFSLAWSPDGKTLASVSSGDHIRIWDTQTGILKRVLKGHKESVFTLAWSPDGQLLASGFRDWKISLTHAGTGELLRTLEGHTDRVYSLAWSPNGQILASGSADHTIRIWNIAEGQSLRIPVGPSKWVFSLAWSPNGKTLASVIGDDTIRLWNPETGQPMGVLEGHKDTVDCVSFSHDGSLLVSKARDETVRLWRYGTWETVAVFEDPVSWPTGLAFNPREPSLAILGEQDKAVRIWDLDFEALINATTRPACDHISAAKVVLAGNDYPGKYTLLRALLGKPYEPIPPAEGLKFWLLHSETLSRPGGLVTRDTYVWDLTGPPGDKAINQLFLDGTALGVLLIDPAQPGELALEVMEWRQAFSRAGVPGCPLLLVLDHDRAPVTQEMERHCEWLCLEQDIVDWIPVASLSGEGVERLRPAILEHIPWERVPEIPSPQANWNFHEFLARRREELDILIRKQDLRDEFQSTFLNTELSDVELDACIFLAQAMGLAWPCALGDYVLLQPERLRGYAMAVLDAARRHPQGLGCVAELDVLNGRIDFGGVERLSDPGQESAMLRLAVDLFLKRELAVREGPFLVFSSAVRPSTPALPATPPVEVVYRFAGTVENIYAALLVRLCSSGAFELKTLGPDMAEFRNPLGRDCGFTVSRPGEGQGVISIFFGRNATMDTKALFLRYIHEHLQKWAEAGTVKRELIYRCPQCGHTVENRQAIEYRLEQGKRHIPCQYCDEPIPLFEFVE
ncbi:MAG TPA: hypothetical protein PLH79_14735 [bacterium]|nr:hypothetical protein [bacterium]